MFRFSIIKGNLILMVFAFWSNALMTSSANGQTNVSKYDVPYVDSLIKKVYPRLTKTQLKDHLSRLPQKEITESTVKYLASPNKQLTHTDSSYAITLLLGVRAGTTELGFDLFRQLSLTKDWRGRSLAGLAQASPLNQSQALFTFYSLLNNSETVPEEKAEIFKYLRELQDSSTQSRDLAIQHLTSNDGNENSFKKAAELLIYTGKESELLRNTSNYSDVATRAILFGLAQSRGEQFENCSFSDSNEVNKLWTLVSRSSKSPEKETRIAVLQTTFSVLCDSSFTRSGNVLGVNPRIIGLFNQMKANEKDSILRNELATQIENFPRLVERYKESTENKEK